MKKVLFSGVALLSVLAFGLPASAQTIDLTGNGGLVIGGGEYELESRGTSLGSNGGVGDVKKRSSFSDSASQNIGELTIDSNHNRTNVGFDGTSYGGATSANSIETRGVHAGSTNSKSATSVSGSMSFVGGAVNLQGTGSISLP